MDTVKKNWKRAATFFIIAIFSFHSTYSQESNKNKQAEIASNVKNMIDTRNYVFKAQSATPFSGQRKQLSPGYYLKITKDTVISDLPYYGRATTPVIDPTETGFEFISKDFEYTVADRKKGGWDITIKTKDQNEVRELSLTIFENGNASLRVTSLNKQNISYQGYIDDKLGK